MIWDHKPAVIVMLTKVQENMKVSTCTITRKHGTHSSIVRTFTHMYVLCVMVCSGRVFNFIASLENEEFTEQFPTCSC